MCGRTRRVMLGLLDTIVLFSSSAQGVRNEQNDFRRGPQHDVQELHVQFHPRTPPRSRWGEVSYDLTDTIAEIPPGNEFFVTLNLKLHS